MARITAQQALSRLMDGGRRHRLAMVIQKAISQCCSDMMAIMKHVLGE